MLLVTPELIWFTIKCMFCCSKYMYIHHVCGLSVWMEYIYTYMYDCVCLSVFFIFCGILFFISFSPLCKQLPFFRLFSYCCCCFHFSLLFFYLFIYLFCSFCSWWSVDNICACELSERALAYLPYFYICILHSILVC